MRAYLLLLALLPSGGIAQDMPMRIVDAGFGFHNLYGRGFELVLEIRGASVRDVPDQAFSEICEQFGPMIIPQLRSHEQSFEPDYIGIRLVGSGLLSSYKFIAFEPNDDRCGPAL